MTSKDQRVILTGKENWDAWIQSMSAKIPRKIWSYMHPDHPTGELLQEPREPQYSDFNTTATDYTQLSQPQQRSFDAVFRQWEVRKRDFGKQETEINTVYDTILETVSTKYRQPLDRKDTLREWMQLLKSSAAPSEGFMMAKVKDEYIAVMKGFKNQKAFPQWLEAWESMMIKAKKYHLAETETGQWLREFADLIEPIHQSYATAFTEGAKTLDAEAVLQRRRLQDALAHQTAQAEAAEQRRLQASSESETLEPDSQSRPGGIDLIAPAVQRPAPNGSKVWTPQEVASTMREWASRKRPTSGNTVRGGTFHTEGGNEESDHSEEASTPKGGKRTKSGSGGRSGKRPALTCPACGMRGHDLPDCWCVFEDKRPEGMPRNDRRMRRAKKALEDDRELQRRVDALREQKGN
ncbi:hypothetical protein EDB80DRAFT_737416 [Ilyonectria destructans]|nr:hypothetical protein EDB80DRAFT_739045 [Ilyonectria destructans]KAH6976669.1 hypothetical protein EDB80DRAFT_739046 [Ilyonectria destructans]KAH6981504.1 hypothetical protein EDB80DRAFT_737416 [Ilyonectria destructans]